MNETGGHVVDNSSRFVALATLRQRITALEGPPKKHTPVEPDSAWLPGIKTLDDALPPNGLTPGALHEASGTTGTDGPSAAAFLVALLHRLSHRAGRDTVLICESDASRSGRLHGWGWRDLGGDPDALLIVRARHDKEVLWAMEEGLRSGALAAVFAEIRSIGFTMTRRLSLAAQESMTPALLLRDDGLVPTSAAATRWLVRTLPSAHDSLDIRAPGAPRWRLGLVRCRGGRPARCNVEWHHEAGTFCVAAALGHRPATAIHERNTFRPAVLRAS